MNFLAALSLNEKIIIRLWKFLYSLGPDGGLKAILSYVTGGSDSLPEALNALLTLFCDCCAHLLPIIDDGEFYEQQKPFTLEESIKMSAFLNSLVFKIIWTREADGMHQFTSFRFDKEFQKATSTFKNVLKSFLAMT